MNPKATMEEFVNELIEKYAKAASENAILKARVEVLEDMLFEYKAEEEREMNSVCYEDQRN